MIDWLINVGTAHPYLVYALVILFASAEGPILSMLFGVALRFGYFSFWPVYVCLMLGDVVGDSFWYWIGRTWGYKFVARYGKYFSIDEHSIARVTRIFHHYHDRVLLISKITNGFGFALVTLMTAGLVRIPFWRYLAVNLIGQFVWTGMLLAVGYFFGNLYLTVDSVLGKLGAAAGFIVVIWLFFGYKQYLKTHAEKLKLDDK